MRPASHEPSAPGEVGGGGGAAPPSIRGGGGDRVVAGVAAGRGKRRREFSDAALRLDLAAPGGRPAAGKESGEGHAWAVKKARSQHTTCEELVAASGEARSSLDFSTGYYLSWQTPAFNFLFFYCTLGSTCKGPFVLRFCLARFTGTPRSRSFVQLYRRESVPLLEHVHRRGIRSYISIY